ncbi:MAG: GlcG/HbpS family heme-binding protein [Vulcanimicrobiaceae bacterium]
MFEITIEEAQRGIAAGLAKARELNSPSSIAVVDSGRNLLAFARMNGALLASIEISQGKAFTARSLNMKTGEVMQYVQPGAPLYSMQTSHRDRPFIVFGGGQPVAKEGTIVGAVGVAGGAVRDDEAVALAVVNAIENT